MTPETADIIRALLGVFGVLCLFSKPKADWSLPHESNREILMRWKRERAAPSRSEKHG